MGVISGIFLIIIAIFIIYIIYSALCGLDWEAIFGCLGKVLYIVIIIAAIITVIVIIGGLFG